MAMMKNNINCPCVVLHIKPISHILTFPVNRQRLSMTNVVNKQRN